MAEKEREKKKKILIIDDEAVNRAILEDYLSSFGYEIYMASNGSEGVDMLEKTAPDLVLLDANPLDNISNTRQISLVVSKGQLIAR